MFKHSSNSASELLVSQAVVHKRIANGVQSQRDVCVRLNLPHELAIGTVILVFLRIIWEPSGNAEADKYEQRVETQKTKCDNNSQDASPFQFLFYSGYSWVLVPCFFFLGILGL